MCVHVQGMGWYKRESVCVSEGGHGALCLSPMGREGVGNSQLAEELTRSKTNPRGWASRVLLL